MDEIDTLIAKINKKLDNPVLVRGSDLRELTFLRQSTGSYSFDVMLGGGWPLNSWNEIVGNESHGKTVMALKTIAAAQNENPDHETLWVASEDFNLRWAETLGVDLTKVTLAQTNAMEEAFNIVIEMLGDRAVDAVVIDSYPALTPVSEFEGDMADWLPGLGARLTNKFMRKSSTAQRRALSPAGTTQSSFEAIMNRDMLRVVIGSRCLSSVVTVSSVTKCLSTPSARLSPAQNASSTNISSACWWWALKRPVMCSACETTT